MSDSNIIAKGVKNCIGCIHLGEFVCMKHDLSITDPENTYCLKKEVSNV